MTAPNLPCPPSKRGERFRLTSGLASGLVRDLAAALAVLGLIFWLSFLLRGPRVLKPGLAVTREITGSEVHRYRARLAAGEWLNVTVDQGGSRDGLDLAVSVRDPQGAVVALADDPNGGLWEEELAWVAQAAGTYALEVRRAGNPEGAYRLQVKALGTPAGPTDTLRAEALRLDQEANRLMGNPDELPHQIQLRRQSQAIWTRLGERWREAEACVQIGSAWFSLGDYEKAVAHHHQAARIWSELANHDQQARAFYEMAKAERKRDRLKEARQAFDQGLALASEPATRMFLLHGRGNLLTDLGKLDAAMRNLRASLELAQSLGDSWAEANALNDLGFAYRSLGRWDDAIGHFQRALATAEAGRFSEIERSAQNGLGGVYTSLGDWDQAIAHYEAALEVAREQGDLRSQAGILNNLALVQHKSLRFQLALRLFKQALDLGELDEGTAATALNNMAFLHVELNQPREALRLCDRAMTLAAGNQETHAAILEARGLAQLKLGQTAIARQYLRQALALSQRINHGSRQVNATLGLGRAARAEGDLTAAIVHAQKAIGIIESFRTGVEDDTLRASFLAAKRDVYDFYVDTLIELHQDRPGEGFDAESLRINEMSRARSLLDLFNQAATQASRRTDPELQKRLQRLRFEVIQLRTESQKLRDDPAPTPITEIAEASRRLKAAEESYGSTQAEIRRQNVGATAQDQYLPLTLAEIQSQVLGEDTLLLEYALGERQSYLWAVTPISLQVFPLPPKREIEKTARSFYDQLLARTLPDLDEADLVQADAHAGRLAAELSRIILGPVERAGLLQKESKILVVSDGALQYIPFSALPLPSSLGAGPPTPARPVLMVEDHEIVHLPSASVLASLRKELDHREPPARTLALIADPVFEREDGRFREGAENLKPAGFLGQLMSSRKPSLRQGLAGQGYTRLHWSKEEADRILRLVPRSQVFEARDFDASVATVTRAQLDQYRLLHFATHGRIDSSQPERSSLVLSLYNRDGEQQDGFLRLADVYNLRLNADLVVLSACETALGKEMRGEGLIGLTRGFMLAGSRRVLASLWSVDDRVTAELMERLYRNMLKEGRSPAAALRQAQRDMLRDEDWGSPYYWAGFSLQGEWR